MWVSEVEPGSVHDLTAARLHALPGLYWAAAADPGIGRAQRRKSHTRSGMSADFPGCSSGTVH